MRLLKILATVQGIYYFITGIWPVADIESFMAVTGPKVDTWLVKTVGVLVMAMAAAMLVAARSSRIDSTVKVLAIGGAVGFMGIDIYYAGFRDRIWDVYLLDAAAQIVFIVLWIAGIVIDSRRSQKD